MESMVNGGWVKLYRELKSKSIWQLSSPEQKVVLITILLLANHEENKWEWKDNQYVCKPGQLITSLNSLVRECGQGVTIQNVRTALERFEKLGFLTNTSTKTGRLITIVNWEKYQGKETGPVKLSENSQQSKSITKVLNPENPTSELTMLPTNDSGAENVVNTGVSSKNRCVADKEANKEPNKALTKSQQTANKELTTNKNDKEYKNDKEIKKKPAAPLFDGEDDTEGIDLWGEDDDTVIRSWEDWKKRNGDL